MTMIWKTSLRNLTILIFSGTPLTFLKKGLIIAESPSFRQHPYRRFCPSSKTGMDCRSWNRFCKTRFARASGSSTTVCKNHRLSAWPAAKVCWGKDRLFEGFRLPHPLPAESNCPPRLVACCLPHSRATWVFHPPGRDAAANPPCCLPCFVKAPLPSLAKMPLLCRHVIPKQPGHLSMDTLDQQNPPHRRAGQRPFLAGPWTQAFYFRLRGKTKRGILIPAKEL